MRNGRIALTNKALHTATYLGMLWLAHLTLDPEGFSSDEAQCFLTVSRNARDPFLAESAAQIHRELIASYTMDLEALRNLEKPNQGIDYLSYCTQSERIGLAPACKAPVQAAIREIGEAFFWNVQPDTLTGENCTTLILYYHFGRLGFRMRHSLQEVIRRCGPVALDRSHALSEDELEEQLYFVTHWVYALSDYGAIPLDREAHAALYGYLRAVLPEALDFGNVETLGEVVECLKIFGHRNGEAFLRPALRQIYKRQNPDGSWGSFRYETARHATWCGVTALYEYREPLPPGVWGPPADRSCL